MIQEILKRRGPNGILVDAGPLLLMMIGRVRPQLIRQFKRTQQYDLIDFELVVQLVDRFGHFLATPHIIAEAGNLGGQLREPYRSEFYARLVEWLQLPASEHAVSSQRLLDLDFTSVSRFGITDSITLVSAGRYPILTDDDALTMELSRRSFDVVNLRQLRAALGT